jgi:tetratricopeptide (TPR) repeat protein
MFMRKPALMLLALTFALPTGNLVHAAGGGGGGGFGGGTISSEPSSYDPNRDYRAALKDIAKARYPKAIKRLEKVIASGNATADVLNWLGYANRKNGNATAALTGYQRALAINPNHVGANEYLGELYLEMKQPDKAEERLAVLDACCAKSPERQQLADAIAQYKSSGTFTAKPPMITY